MNSCLPLLATNTPKSTPDVEYVEIKMPGCDECEEIMTGAISKFKGVEKCVKDVENQKIAVSGSFNQAKLLRKLSSKTGKEMEIVMNDEKNVEETVGKCQGKCLETLLKEDDEKSEMVTEGGQPKDMEKNMMFSDENPNVKCVIS